MQAPTWDQFAWAVFLYKAITVGDKDYRDIAHSQVLSNLQVDPGNVDLQQIQTGVTKFLNRWKCRIPNNRQSAKDLRNAIQGLVPYLQALKGFDIDSIDFNQNLVVNGNPSTVNQAIEHCYTNLKGIVYRFAATATSKLLHILQPNLFVMWDDPILRDYHKDNLQITDNGQGYRIYLQEMNKMAKQVCQNFQEATLNPPSDTKNPAVYLSKQLEYDYPKTLAKYLDEYNWVRITYKIPLPPSWHP